MRILPLVLALAACTGSPEESDTPIETDTDTDTDTDADTDTDTDSDTDTDVPDTDVPVEVSDEGLQYRFAFDGDTVDSGPFALPVVGGADSIVWTTDRHGTADAAMGSGTCLRYGDLAWDGSGGAFSLAAWVRPGATFSSGGRNTLGGQMFYQWYYSGGTWTTEVYEYIDDVRRPTFLSAAAAAPEGTWTHIAFVFDVTGGGQFYADGAPIATTGSDWASVIQTTTWTVLVGCGGDASFDAGFDEVALWARRLSADEIAELASR